MSMSRRVSAAATARRGAALAQDSNLAGAPEAAPVWRAYRGTARLSAFKRALRPQPGRTTMAQRKSLNVNGKSVRITIDDPEMPLLYALRDNLALRGPRFGCGLGQCGACTVHVDGKAVRSCQMPLSRLTPAQQIVTLEGLGSPQRPHPVQKAFIDTQAAQCG